MTKTATAHVKKLQFYHDVFVTAMEDPHHVLEVLKYKHYSEGLEWVPKMADAFAVVKDVEQDGKEYHVTLKTIAAAFDKLRAAKPDDKIGLHASYRSRFIAAENALDAGEIDAYDAMLILQLGIFGECIYG